MNDDDLSTFTLDDMSLDPGYGAVPPSQYNITGGSGIDTITIDPGWLNAGSITIPSTTISSIGTSYTSASNTQWTTGTGGYTFTSSTPPNTVSINTTGIDMAAGTDIKIDGKSLKEFMTKMEQRMAILIPDPAKLEKFQALKQAYEHYKTMESLCFDEPEEEK
jgi:hypothetical protein